MKCLLVVDVQNGFVSKETKFVVPRISSLLQSFTGLKVTTQFINRQGSPYETILKWNRLREEPEIDILEEIRTQVDHIVKKNIYSACTPEFLDLLAREKVDEVYITGIDTDCCVLKTAIDLFELGIRPVVLAHCCASNGGMASHTAALTVLGRTIGREQIVMQ